MGIYLRNSIKVGPLRFNLSGSGIGVSGGVRGFRVGTGPRGNYVHMGRHGLYYRATLPPHRNAGADLPRRISSSPPLPQTQLRDGLVEIDSGNVEEMIHSSSTELLEEIRMKARLPRRWPMALVLGCITWLVAVTVLPWWASLALLCTVLILTYQLKRRDELRRTVILMYSLDQNAEVGWQGLHNGFDWLASSQHIWHLEARGGVTDRKRNAGASHLVRRTAIRPIKADPPNIRTNIAVPSIPVGGQTLYLLPDRILIFQGSTVGAVGYDQLNLEAGTTRFIESESVPGDAPVVGSTWQYVNKSGGPDRRFSNNRQLPILQYGEIHLTSPTGLNEAIQVSNPKAPGYFALGLSELVEKMADGAKADGGS
jgi:Protein of unknown function (DUF4236)